MFASDILDNFDDIINNNPMRDPSGDEVVEPTEVYQEIPNSFKYWHKYSIELLKTAIASGHLSHLTFYLGPALYPIQCNYFGGNTKNLQWQVHVLDWLSVLKIKIIEAIEVYENLIKNNRIFENQATKLSSSHIAPSIKSKFNRIKVMHEKAVQEVEESGLMHYANWASENKNSIEECRLGLFMGVGSEVVTVNQMILSQNDITKLKNNLEKLLEEYSTHLIQKAGIEPSVKEHARHALNSMRNVLTHAIGEHPDFIRLKKAISNHFEEIMKTNGLDVYNSAIESECNRYKIMARQAMQEMHLRASLQDILQDDPEVGYKGLSEEEFIQLVIDYNKGVLFLLHHAQEIMGVFNVVLSLSADLQTSFQNELENHWISPRFEAILNGSHARRIMRSHYALSDRPLEWDRLRLIMNYLPCVNENQANLKDGLHIYLAARNFDDSYWEYFKSHYFYDEKILLTRRAQIEFLISCIALDALEDPLMIEGALRLPESGAINNVINTISHEKSHSALTKKVNVCFSEGHHSYLKDQLIAYQNRKNSKQSPPSVKWFSFYQSSATKKSHESPRKHIFIPHYS